VGVGLLAVKDDVNRTIDDARIRSLAAAARALGRSAQLTTMVEIAAEEARKALDAASVSISRLEPGTGSVRTVINVGSLGPTEERWPSDELYHLDDFRRLQSVVADLQIWTMSLGDPDADPGEIKLLSALDKGSAMGAPLVVDGKLWGELYATRERGDLPFDDSDQAYTETLTAILAGAISRAVHVEALEQMAFRDPLTGLANRRELDRAIALAFDSITQRPGRRVIMVAVDVNGLKEVNDAYGHSEGDRLLTSVASLLQQTFSGLHGSLVSRVGGDEFVVLIPGHDLDQVMATARQLCSDARDLRLGTGVACGVASTNPAEPLTAAALLSSADFALYQAKRRQLTGPYLAAPGERLPPVVAPLEP
jgi:diguanylate cyclase (GGDEF)-like protein